MKQILFYLIALVMVACVNKENISIKTSSSPKDVVIISAQELKDNYLNDDDYIIMDNRPIGLYQSGHIKRAINLTYKSEGSFENVLTKEKLLKVIQNKKVILYCNGFMRAYNAVHDAVQKWKIPVEKLVWFKGGMTEWLRNGYPIEAN